MKRVFITGASGFVGSAALAPLRACGYELHCAGRSAPRDPDVVFHAIDLLRDDPLPLLARIAPSHLLHIAWHADRATIWTAPDNLAWVAASLRLALAFRQTGGRRAVFAGSAAEYDWSVPLLDDASTDLRPATLYGRAKATLASLLSQGALTPVSVGWARIFFPFGANDRPDRLLSEIIDKLSRGETAHCSSGHQVRPFIHVDDVGAALAALLDSPAEGAVNIALDEVCSVREIALAAARLAGDPALLQFGKRPLQPGEPAEMRATTHRLTREVGFHPRHTIAQGVAATVAARLRERSTLG